MNGLMILFAFLNAADGWTTWQVIRFGGNEIGVPKYPMEILGTYWTLVILKVGIVIAVWVINYFDPLPTLFMALVDIGYAVLVVWNYIQLQRSNTR